MPSRQDRPPQIYAQLVEITSFDLICEIEVESVSARFLIFAEFLKKRFKKKKFAAKILSQPSKLLEFFFNF